jgi:hypothetical protein
MRTARVASLVGLMLIGSAGNSFAQEPGDIGLSMGYPTSVAVLWHVTNRVAIRPEVSLNWTSSELEVALPVDGGEASTDSFSTAVGVSALFYLGTTDRLRTYVSPRINYVRTAIDYNLPFTPDFDRTLDGFQFAGSFGAQFAVGDRFGVFGEVGLAYSSSSTTIATTPTETETRMRSFGTRTTAGVTFYF